MKIVEKIYNIIAIINSQ